MATSKTATLIAIAALSIAVAVVGFQVHPSTGGTSTAWVPGKLCVPGPLVCPGRSHQALLGRRKRSVSDLHQRER
jgi:hypothetical protein